MFTSQIHIYVQVFLRNKKQTIREYSTPVKKLETASASVICTFLDRVLLNAKFLKEQSILNDENVYKLNSEFEQFVLLSQKSTSPSINIWKVHGEKMP